VGVGYRNHKTHHMVVATMAMAGIETKQKKKLTAPYYRTNNTNSITYRSS
jgi:hypothetical protein